MKNYENTLARYKSLKQELEEVKEIFRANAHKHSPYRDEIISKYNQLIRQFSNVQINLNQIKMRTFK